MGAIFISYRRGDSEGQAGRLFDELVQRFGEQAVFMDVAGIEPGRDFREAIEDHVASCDVLLALMGKGWLDASNEAGQRRLDDPRDFVRRETASALKRDIPVVPVLVQGARMPLVTQLPEELAELAFRNAIELSHARWDSDVAALVKALSRYVTPSSAGADARASAVKGRHPTLRLAAALAIAVLGGGGVAYGFKQDGREVREHIEPLQGSVGAPPPVGAAIAAQPTRAPQSEAAAPVPKASTALVLAPPSLPSQAEPAPVAAEAAPDVTLISWWSSAQGDNFLTTEPPWFGRAGASQGSWEFSTAEGKIFDAKKPQPPGTVPLFSWRSDQRQGHVTQDYRTTSALRWRVPVRADGSTPKAAPLREGYRPYRLEGYVYDPMARQPPGTRPLFAWYNAQRGDYFTTTQAHWCMPLAKRKFRCEGASSTAPSREGYAFVRLEGFVR
jgi:hypothetical protein